MMHPSEHQRAPWVNDLSKEIEVVRHVIIKENDRLSQQLRKLEEAHAVIRESLGMTMHVGYQTAASDWHGCDTRGYERSIGRSIDSARPSNRRRRTVEWRVLGVTMPSVGDQLQSDHSSFKLPEYPGVCFDFELGVPWSTSSSGQEPAQTPPVSKPRFSRPCQLSLRVSGNGCAGSCMRVSLDAQTEPAANTGGDEVMTSPAGVQRSRALTRSTAGASGRAASSCDSSDSGEGSDTCSPGSDSSSTANPRLGELTGALLYDGGQVICRCSWPSTSQVTVVCRAHIEFVGYINGTAAPLIIGGARRRAAGSGDLQAS